VPVDNKGHYYKDLEDLLEIMVDLKRKPCNGKFKSLDEIQRSAGSILDHCFDKYLVDVELLILKNAFDAYNDAISNRYNDKFKVYKRVVRQQALDSVDAYIRGA
jgi:hypothetical protein